MRLQKVNVKKATKELVKFRPLRSQIDTFKENLIDLLSKIDNGEREEHLKNNVRDFLLNTYYKETNFINTKEATDLVIHNGKTNKETVGVIIETKRPGNKSEMLSLERPNAKALHELVLYYMDERIGNNNLDIKHCIATNIYEWFIIDAQWFDRVFAKNKSFVKDYKEWKSGQKVTKDTGLFYNDIVKPFVDSLNEEVPVTYFDIRSYEKELKDANTENDKKLISLYKVHSPYHLLRKSAADSNTLNNSFYKELLYIIGLEEAKDGGKNIIRRRQQRNPGSLIENTITLLETVDLYRINNLSQYGKTKEDRHYNIALELCLTWVNRILFLKLLEGQLVNYHRGDENYRFLDARNIHDYDELYKLFHLVLARTYDERKEDIREKYSNVPYLNSSLFEKTELESLAIGINSLDNRVCLELMQNSVLKERVRKNEQLRSIDYIFRFLDAYDFASDGKDDIQEDNKALISASVLGKVFEKINGYKDGSIYTPGFITMYMCREAIRKSVVQKFNEHYDWNCETIEDVYNKTPDIKEANKIVNSIKICDPAVGSGHFLVSALNEIIAIKAELAILVDEHGKRIRDYSIEIINDELVILDDYNDPFIYNPNHKESQRVQKTLFQEKRTIIENCLFGVDINANSVKICRLRLWIELLKNAYYKEDRGRRELETLPNIDINIKCGNSLLSRYSLETDLTSALKTVGATIPEYRNAVYKFKNETDREAKHELQKLIDAINKGFQTYFSIHDERRDKASKARGELTKLQSDTLFESKKKDAEIKKKIDALNKKIQALDNEINEIKNNAIYQNAFEWRFEFPEVLNDNGDFEGFDVLIGNPPYIQLQKMGAAADVLQQQGYRTYARTGDIYSLFYEKGWELLKPKGVLCFITSNKWMRAGYGESTRAFLAEHTNPLLLINFAGQKLFDAATVEVNILMFSKDKNRQQTLACTIADDVLKDLSDFPKQVMSFATRDSWVILSPIELSIKSKIEAIGTPLKDWDINIYRGILTGYNEAFIIDSVTKDRLIAEDPKSAEIIRPILRGRDIRRYSYEFAGQYLIATFPSLSYNIENYPAIKAFLEGFKPKLAQTGKKLTGAEVEQVMAHGKVHEIQLKESSLKTARKTTNNQWFETQDSISYWEDFYRQKIVWGEISDNANFALDNEDNYFVNNKCYLMTGNQLEYLVCFLNSHLSEYLFSKIATTTGVGTLQWSKFTIEQLLIPAVSDGQTSEFSLLLSELKSSKTSVEAINLRIYEICGLSKEEIDFIEARQW